MIVTVIIAHVINICVLCVEESPANHLIVGRGEQERIPNMALCLNSCLQQLLQKNSQHRIVVAIDRVLLIIPIRIRLINIV